MLSSWAIKKLEHLTLDYFPITCLGERCYGFVAVHRIQFALGVFHAVLAAILVGVKSSKGGRAAIQNGLVMLILITQERILTVVIIGIGAPRSLPGFYLLFLRSLSLRAFSLSGEITLQPSAQFYFFFLVSSFLLILHTPGLRFALKRLKNRTLEYGVASFLAARWGCTLEA